MKTFREKRFQIGNIGGRSYNYQVQTVAAEGESYCIEVMLNSGNWVCVDGSGTSEQYVGDPDCSAAQQTKLCN